MTLHRDLGVASYNIHKGVGADRRRDLMRTAAVISEIGADILALQEADTRFGSRRGLLDLDHLRADQGLVPVPVEGAGAAHGWHGNLILVRNALVQTVHKLVLPGLEPRGALMADVARITAIHGPNPARPAFWGGIRIRPLEIEFWADGAFRLHDRFRWSRSAVAEDWTIVRLNP